MVSRKSGLFKHYCLETTVLGLKYLYLYPDKVSRIYWSASVVSALVLACFLTKLLWFRFFEMPTRITIENQFSPIFDIPFPAVAVCSPNQISKPHVEHFKQTLVDGSLHVDVYRSLPALMGFYEQSPGNPLDPQTLDNLQTLLNLNRYEIRDVVSYLPQTCEEFLVACFWEAREWNCSELFQPVLTSQGMCCAFNTRHHFNKQRYEVILEGIEESFQPWHPREFGAEMGLTVVTDYRPEDALDGTLLNEGATQLLFYDSTEFPSADERTMVPPHVESYHIIEASVTNCSEDVTALPIESRKCVFEHEYKLNYFSKYRNTDCDIDSLVTEMFRRCGCLQIYVPHNQRNICNIADIPCILRTRSVLGVNWTNKPDCPRECMSRRYRVRSIIGNMAALQHIYHDRYKGINFTSSHTIMHVFYQSPFYVANMQETVVSYINLISNLGGVFGLCLGCSVVSLFEILFFFTRLIGNYSKRRRAIRRWSHIRRVIVAERQ